jgi:flagellar protein FlaI
MKIDFAKILADMKPKETKLKLPKFSLPKTKMIIKLPEKKTAEVKYPLIPPFAFADLKYDKKEAYLIYNVLEPSLNQKEKELYQKIINSLLEVLDIELSSIKKREEAMEYLEDKIRKILEELEIKITDDLYKKIMYFIYRNFIGLNEIEPLMNDPYIEDISCDGTNVPLFIVHRKYGSLKTNIVFEDSQKLLEFVTKLSERTGRFISYAEPLLDGTLPDGSRVQASFSQDVTTKGPTFTIRKYTETPFSPVDLAKNKTVSTEVLAYLWMAVESGASILIAGGAATGKTTMLNTLSMFIPPQAKIISIEDTRELNLPHENWIPSVARAGFAKGYGEVTMFDLLKEAFRQTPDYVIVGEIRGQEAYVMFQGMAAGMPSIGTMHAGKVEDVIHRLETPPINLSPALIETLDIVVIMVHAKEKGESSRRIKEIVEIESIDEKTGTARTNRAYSWLPSEDEFEYRGYSWLLQEISKLKGIGIESLQKDMLTRKKILDWMVKKDLRDYKEVAQIISDYYRDPKKVIKMVK